MARPGKGLPDPCGRGDFESAQSTLGLGGTAPWGLLLPVAASAPPWGPLWPPGGRTKHPGIHRDKQGPGPDRQGALRGALPRCGERFPPRCVCGPASLARPHEGGSERGCGRPVPRSGPRLCVRGVLWEDASPDGGDALMYFSSKAQPGVISPSQASLTERALRSRLE